jgi:hypothetical protein
MPRATVVHEFEHHAILMLGDGRTFQIASSDFEGSAGERLVRAGARIEHVFSKRTPDASTEEVYVSDDLIAQLGA